jgi:cytochrome c oxidase assembly factor CtaG/putative copper export protein
MTSRPATGSSAPSAPTDSRTRLAFAIAVPFAAATAIVSMYYSEALTSYRTMILDPGDFVVHAKPIARALQDMSAALTVGLLILTATILPPSRDDKNIISFAQWSAIKWAKRSAGVWLVAATFSLMCIGADTAGQSFTSPGYFTIFIYFLQNIEGGQILLFALFMVALLCVWMPFVRNGTDAGIALGIAAMGILPLALAGHASGSDDHSNAVNSLALHVLSITVWVGGLLAILLLGKRLGRDNARVLKRYSSLAGWSFLAVAVSGTVNAYLRVETLSALLGTEYGVLILVKAGLFTMLGIAGLVQRRRILPRLAQNPEDRRAFTRFAVSEAVVMLITIGVSVGVAASPPPVSQGSVADVDLRRSLLGYNWPGLMTPESFMTSWYPDWIIGFLMLAVAAAYMRAVVRLRRRGDTWSIPRTAAFLVGCLLLIWLTSAGPAVFGKTSFSGHMIQHMGIMLYAPILLVLGAPTLLLLRATTPRPDGSMGLREWTLWAVNSRFSHFLTRPPVAGVLFAGSMVAFYYTPFFGYALQEHTGHIIMYVHFLITGYLFAWVLIGIDPGPDRAPYPFRLIVLLATMVFHAFFGLSLMSGTEILAQQWWADLQLTNTDALLADQQRGGAIAWGVGELPTLALAIGVAISWRNSDEREARRSDRKADRDGDRDLTPYNEKLAALAAPRGTTAPSSSVTDTRAGVDDE